MRLRPSSALLVVVLALGACSGDGGDDGRADGAGDTGAEVADTAEPAATAEPGETAATAPTAPAGSAGCGTAPDVDPVTDELPGDVEQAITVAGVERAYRLGVPEGYDPDVPTPLVLNLHGSGSDAAQASLYGDVPRRAAARGVLTVAAQGIDGVWELGAGADTDYLTALLDDVESRYCVDPTRVHGVGNSLGAAKMAFFACSVGDRFASLALVTVEVFPGECAPMPVVAFHGTADPVVAYGEGGGSVDAGATPNAAVPGTLANMAGWAESGGCGTEPTVEPIGDDVERRVYGGCGEGVDVELYTVLGGGHTWPGAEIEIGPTTRTISATDLMLDWFAAHPRP